MDLTNYNWDEVYVDDPNQVYDAFLFTFIDLYNNHCPIRKCWVKNKYKGKPWMTKSIVDDFNDYFVDVGAKRWRFA